MRAASSLPRYQIERTRSVSDVTCKFFPIIGLRSKLVAGDAGPLFAVYVLGGNEYVADLYGFVFFHLKNLLFFLPVVTSFFASDVMGEIPYTDSILSFSLSIVI